MSHRADKNSKVGAANLGLFSTTNPCHITQSLNAWLILKNKKIKKVDTILVQEAATES